MRIAIISNIGGCAWGGSEELWSALALAAAQVGHEVIASVHRWPEPRPKLEALRAAGVRIVEHAGLELPPGRRKHRFYVRHPNFAARWTSRLSIFSPLLRPRPDVVLISQGDTYGLSEHAEFGWLLEHLRREGIPCAAVCHLSQEDRIPPDGARERAVRAFNELAAVAFVSERQKQVVEHQLAQALPRARVLRNPVNLADTRAVPWPEKVHPLRLAIVARVAVVHKGHDLALRALAQPAWRERDWRLSIVGEGPHSRYVRDLANYLGIAGRVDMLGHCRDIRAVWAEHHALLLPSRMEAAPLTIVEAMLCARPCIATDVGGVAEWIEDGATGFVAAYPHQDALAQALERAWQVRERWPQMGQAGRDKALKQIDPQPGVTLLNLLTKLAQAAPSGS